MGGRQRRLEGSWPDDDSTEKNELICADHLPTVSLASARSYLYSLDHIIASSRIHPSIFSFAMSPSC